MRIRAVLCVLSFLAMTVGGRAGAAETGRQTLSFDQDWRFHLGDVEGAEKPEFKDAGWRALDVPHDWSIEGPVGKDPATMEGPFDRSSPAGAGGGYLNGGIGWYRKSFTLPETAHGQRITVQFDGAYMDSDVWINGTHLGHHPYGYTSFEYDLTPNVKYGSTRNVLAVRMEVKQPCSRWYSGAGLTRHVWLTRTQPVHVERWGTYVTTPEITGTTAQVRVRTHVRNDGTTGGDVTLSTVILDPDGKAVGRSQTTNAIAADGDHAFDQTFPLTSARRWSLENPARYRAVSEVRVGSALADTVTTSFGIRSFQFTRDKGFFLNEKHVQIQGVCDHHDLGCLGSAVNRRGLERQLEILKTMGCNAIRTSHNPPAPELLELCDQMGFVVMDEAFDEWKASKTRNGYGRFFDDWSEKDLVSMLHRDRNHPCVILWSIGNEIPEQGAMNAEEMSRRLADICHREDPTRPVTSACNSPGRAVRTGFSRPLDVLGINYNIGSYADEKDKALLIGSETASALSTRGEYGLVLGASGSLEIQQKRNNQCTSYDLVRPGWGCTAETSLKALKNAPWVAGEFVWTGFDYIGEPTPYSWPSRSSYFGIVDLCGFPKDRYYLYQSQWTDKPMVHLLPHWNWEGFEGKEIPVWCFTNADSVELFLNDRSLGVKDGKGIDSLHLEWMVPYAPGVLKAVAKKDGKVVAQDEVTTAGKPARIALVPDRKRILANGEDLSFVQVRILDKEGHLCPDADQKVTFALTGSGVIAGVDNGDPTNHEPFKGQDRENHKAEHKAFHGLGLVVIQSGRKAGTIHLTATAEGLTAEPISLTVGP